MKTEEQRRIDRFSAAADAIGLSTPKLAELLGIGSRSYVWSVRIGNSAPSEQLTRHIEMVKEARDGLA